MRVAVTLETELPHTRTREQFLICRTVRCMTRRAAFDLQRCMLENEWSLLIRVTLETSSISARRETRLLEFETAMRIVTIAALHLSFEHFVMKRPAELCFRLGMTTDA